MKFLMLAHAFRYVERVVFGVGSDNWRSRRALEKIGARVLRQEARPGPDGAAADFVVFGISRPS